MEIELLRFGKISDIITAQRLHLPDIHDTNGLRTYLEHRYPALAGMKYVIALNQLIVTENTTISAHDTVALMPPFSGG